MVTGFLAYQRTQISRLFKLWASECSRVSERLATFSSCLEATFTPRRIPSDIRPRQDMNNASAENVDKEMSSRLFRK